MKLESKSFILAFDFLPENLQEKCVIILNDIEDNGDFEIQKQINY